MTEGTMSLNYYQGYTYEEVEIVICEIVTLL